MSSTPSSRRRITWCFLCIETDGIVGKFSARQHLPKVWGVAVFEVVLDA